MPIGIKELGGDVVCAELSGRLDIAGAEAIDLPMNVIAGSRRSVVVDLAEVEFIGSMGLRAIVMLAKTVQRRGGKVVLLSPRTEVAEVITTSGIDDLVPILHDQAAAIAAVTLG